MKIKRFNRRKAVNLLINTFQLILVFGFCYVILKPIVQYVFYAFMSPEDFNDFTVSNIPKNWSFYNWRKAAELMDLIGMTGFRSLFLSVTVALLQMISSIIIGYGLARFEFKGKKILIVMLFAVMLVPPSVLQLSQYFQFRFFGIDSISLNFINTLFPNYILSACGLGLKQALYIFLMRSMFMQLPNDLENAAYIDGATIFKTFISVMVPNARSLMITVFLFSFCWTWTDVTYATAFYPNLSLLSNQLVLIGGKLHAAGGNEGTVVYGGMLLMMIPMLILMAFCQKHIVKSIAMSGLAN